MDKDRVIEFLQSVATQAHRAIDAIRHDRMDEFHDLFMGIIEDTDEIDDMVKDHV